MKRAPSFWHWYYTWKEVLIEWIQVPPSLRGFVHQLVFAATYWFDYSKWFCIHVLKCKDCWDGR